MPTSALPMNQFWNHVASFDVHVSEAGFHRTVFFTRKHDLGTLNIVWNVVEMPRCS